MKKYICILFLLVLVGCAPKAVVVLMPDAEGKVGVIEVATKGGTKTIKDAGYGVHIESTESAPSEPAKMEEKKINKLFGAAIAIQPILPKQYNLYFISGEAQLTSESKSMLPQIIAEIKVRPTVDISIIGHTDRVGTNEYNYKLSYERAKLMYDILVSEGLPAGSIDVTSHGEENPLIPTADDVPEPKNRRVEVTVR